VVSLWRSIFLLVATIFAVSFDGMLVGMAYAAKGLRFHPSTYGLMGTCTGALMGVAMISGRLACSWFSPGPSRVLGSMIMTALGIWQIVQGRGERDSGHSESGLSCSIKSGISANQRTINFGLIIGILKEPLSADQDRSGTIDGRESVLLGIALGLDAFGVGLAASMTGFSLMAIPLVALSCPLFVMVGTVVSRRMKLATKSKSYNLLPGIVLTLIGVLKFLGIV